MTNKQIRAMDKEMGERFAQNAINAARNIYPSSKEKQVAELRWWMQVYQSHGDTAIYSLPVIAAEIRRLEEN